jgi:hypothetical protein
MGATPLTYWTFSETAGSTDTVCVAINVTSVPNLQFSPRVELYDPNGVPYFGAEFDLQGAHICNRSWTVTGTYKVGVFNTLGGPDFYPNVTGSFNLEFVRPGQPFDSGQLGGGNLVPGVPSSGSVHGEYYQLWSLPANAGDLVTVTARNVTGDMPGYVNLVFQGYDPSGGEMSTSSDDPPVYSFKANSTGVYTILAFQISGGNPLANPMTYTITATGSTAVNCSANVTLLKGLARLLGPQYMVAQFKPLNNATLQDYATACHFSYFDWQQTITTLYAGNGLSGKTPNDVPVNNLQPLINSGNVAVSPGVSACLVNWLGCSLIAPPPFYDPPSGGYLYQNNPVNNPQGVPYDPFPFYYPSNGLSPGTCILPDQGCPLQRVSLDDTTLSFLDAPATLNGFIAFRTALVGVSNSPTSSSISCAPGSALYCSTLFSWTWNSTFNGTAGGTHQTSLAFPIDPGSGTGDVTVTGINGAQLPPVVPSTQVAATASGLAYSRVSQTFNGTVTVKNISGSEIGGPFQILFLGVPSAVSLANATGGLSGTPYLTIPAAPSLAPGQSVTVSVQFKNPSNATMTLTPVIYSGDIN